MGIASFHKTNKLKVVFATLALMLSVFFLSDKIFADSEGLPFTVEPILPSNQNSDVSSYISVSSDGNSLNQTYEFKLVNESSMGQEVNVKVVDAYTSPNGVIQYVDEESENSEIVKGEYKLSEHLKIEDEVVKLDAGETKIVSASISVDDTEGVLLGGVSFSSVKEGEKDEQGVSSFQLNSEINLVVGVMVSFDGDNDVKFDIDKPFVDPMPSYFAIRLPITLDSPVLVQDAMINYEVLYKEEKLFDNEKNIDFAPYTKTNVSIPFEHEEIKENGEYVIKGALIYEDENGNVIEKKFEEMFKYVKEDKVNEVAKMLKAPFDGNGVSPYWFLLLLPLIGWLAFVLWKRKKDNDEGSDADSTVEIDKE